MAKSTNPFAVKMAAAKAAKAAGHTKGMVKQEPKPPMVPMAGMPKSGGKKASPWGKGSC